MSAYDGPVQRTLRFVLVLVAGLALLTWAAMVVVNDTMQTWFERDVTLRAQLALNGSARGLASAWRKGDNRELRNLLEEITRDDRILGAAAYSPALRLLAATPDCPTALLEREFSARSATGGVTGPWRAFASPPGGRVHVSALPLVDGGETLGTVVLVHDMSFVERREATTRQFLLVAFGVLAAAASVVTLVASRLSWRRWSDEIRRFLRGGGPRPEFRPLLQDVRDLVGRIAAEAEGDGRDGAWTPQRLKQTLVRHLHGERIVIVANREPYIHSRAPGGGVEVLHPASGLVTALEPVMRACSGVWVAHGSGTADRETADRHGRVRVPPGEESYVVRRVWLGEEEEKGYYYGFANEGLWPLCHIAHTRPVFRKDDWEHYRAVNRKFADAVCAEVDSEDPIVLVQDYHFALVPGLLRRRLPKATILSFWHIPWPTAEQFGICPWRNELLEGMLGSSILGFHTRQHCNNFVETVDRYMESRIDREETAVEHGGRRTAVRAYPISIEFPNRWAREAPTPEACRAAVFAELGLAPDALLGVGVDRLDYTKGVEERLLAVERLLERFPEYRGRFTFAQVAAPSRTAIDRYRRLGEDVEALAARINRRFAKGSWRPVVLLRAHHEPPQVFRYYRAASLCYVSSLHDGMNLVAKEFVAARDDDRGVLVLSHFAGASRELTEALIVNPYDAEAASSALAAALAMPAAEQGDRMRAMRSYLAEFNVYRWAGRMLVDAARLRSRERLTDSLLGSGRHAG
jgi:trehalose 6-phosphate synthase